MECLKKMKQIREMCEIGEKIIQTNVEHRERVKNCRELCKLQKEVEHYDCLGKNLEGSS